MPNALYICYFGIREPLVETQVLPYLREIVKMDGLRMSLVTFEPRSAVAELRSYGVAKLRNELSEQGIDWHWLRYHKRVSVVATAWDIFRGTLFVARFISRAKIDVLHARVHVPMLMAALARKFSRRKPKILFDIRGFFPEEYVDAGTWPAGGWLYRIAKRVERWLMLEADGFVVLTERAREILFPESLATGRDRLDRPVEVIPCCIDPERFNGPASRDDVRRRLGVEDRFVIAYVGSFGGWYLTDEMLDLFAAVRDADRGVYVLILTQRGPRTVIQKMRDAGFTDDDFLVLSVSPADLPAYLLASDAAVSLIKRCYSKQASSPTKNAEYLAAGLPIVANAGVGDVDQLIRGEGVGVLIDHLDRDSYLHAFRELRALGDVSERCRDAAKRHFDLSNIGGGRYRRLYARLTLFD